MTKSSFYGDTPNYATTFPTQNDTSAKPVTGNTQAPSSFYQNGTSYTALALTSPANALYLGSFAADPTLNLIGGALVAGNLYYNTTSGTLKSYNGSAWASLGGSSGVSSAFGRTGAVVATANDYSFAQLSATPTTVAGYGITDAAPLASPAFTGTPSAPTATLGTNTTQLATTAFVLANAGTGGASPATVAPLMDATAAVGTSLLYARQDHVHPTDTSIATGLALKAPLASPSFTGTPTTAATPAALDNSLKLATTAYADGAVSTLSGTVTTALGLKAPLASPALTGVPVAPTAAALNNSTQLATTAYADAAVSTLSGTTTTALALKAPLASPTLTGVPAAPTAAVSTNTTQLATTAFVLGQLATVAPLIDGTAAVGTSLLTARQDHVHPTDTTRAPLASPAFTGTPTVPTATALTNSTTAASTAYADAAVSTLSGTTTTALALKAPLAAPTFTGVPAAPTAAANTNTTQLATTAFVVGQAATVAPVINGTATVGTSLLYARQDHVHPTDTTRAALASPTFTGVPAAPTATVGTNTTQLATTAFVIANAVATNPALLRNYIAGLGMSTAGASTTFTTAVGVAVDTTNANFMTLAAATAKTTAAWAVGTAVGGLDTGTIAASTWYHVYLIKRLDTLVVDVIFSLSATAPTYPTNYTVSRRIGSLKTNASSQWTKFIQDGDRFMWDVPTPDVNATNPGTAAVTRAISTPLGVRVRAYVSVIVQTATANTDATAGVYISDLSVTDSVPAASAAISFEAYFPIVAVTASGGVAEVYTNTSSQVRTRLQLSGAGSVLTVGTLGWTDTRGKDA